MSPADPERKMSKSYGAKHVIHLMEPEDSIHQKIKTAVTDVGPQPDKGMSPGVKNLFTLLKLTAPPDVYDQFLQEYDKRTLKYVALKEAVFEHLMRTLEPIRQRRRALTAHDARVKRRIGVGAEALEALSA